VAERSSLLIAVICTCTTRVTDRGVDPCHTGRQRARRVQADKEHERKRRADCNRRDAEPAHNHPSPERDFGGRQAPCQDPKPTTLTTKRLDACRRSRCLGGMSCARDPQLLGLAGSCRENAHKAEVTSGHLRVGHGYLLCALGSQRQGGSEYGLSEVSSRRWIPVIAVAVARHGMSTIFPAM
jgi:hypothetical protein